MELARKLIDVATGRYGIAIEDIVIDPLAMPVGADTGHGIRTLETIALLREEFGVNMTLGASNVSFGMPDRHSIGAAFLPVAISHGLTSAIMDARSPQVVRAVKAADLLLDRDPWGAYSLEWGVPSPPPEFNFPEGVPVISATGVTYRPVAMANGGHKEAHEATSYETESHEEHWSHWPIVVAAGAGIALWGLLMGLPALLFGTVVLAAAFTGWGRETLRGRFAEPIEAVGEKWPFERLENLPLGMWIFIFGEIAFFGTLFGAYAFLRMNSPLTDFVWPRPGEVHNISLGGFNTILLLTSGLTMVFALTFARRGSYVGLQGSLVATFSLGAFFMVNKALEWKELFAGGFTFGTSTASSIYYVLTGVHGAHVVAGLVALIYLMVKAVKAHSTTQASGAVEVFGIYWGMVDAVWIFLFPLLYLL